MKLIIFSDTHHDTRRRPCLIRTYTRSGNSQEQGITLMNPGQMEFHKERQKASYGLVTIINNEFNCEIINFPGEFNEFY